MRTPLLMLVAVAAALFNDAALAASLPDTGETLCVNYPYTDLVSCSAANKPLEDGLRGRDAAYRTGFSVKAGGGLAGFDYTKVCNSGDMAGSGTCPPEPVWGTGPAEWACTRDNITGLTWEVKVDDSTNIHHRLWRFAWYEPDPAINGGDPGVVGDDTTCPLSECNTQSFAAAMNAAGLCGYSDWRLPSVRELQTIIALREHPPYIDLDYLSASPYYMTPWTATTSAESPTLAWAINMSSRTLTLAGTKSNRAGVVLVRGTPF